MKTAENGQLRALIERIERMEEEKRTIADDIKDVYAEAKGNGFDVKIMRKIVAMRRQDENKRREEEEVLDLYMSALGMQPRLPLGEEERIARAARSPSVQKAIKGLGTPVEPTEEEKSKGVIAAFVGKDGTRMSIAPGRA